MTTTKKPRRKSAPTLEELEISPAMAQRMRELQGIPPETIDAYHKYVKDNPDDEDTDFGEMTHEGLLRFDRKQQGCLTHDQLGAIAGMVGADMGRMASGFKLIGLALQKAVG